MVDFFPFPHQRVEKNSVPSVTLVQNIAQTVPTSVLTLLNFDEVVGDPYVTGRAVKLSADPTRITVPAGFRYARATAFTAWAVEVQNRFAVIRLNNVTIARSTVTVATSEAAEPVLARWFPVNDGDYFTLLASQFTGADLNTSGPNWPGPCWLEVEFDV